MNMFSFEVKELIPSVEQDVVFEVLTGHSQVMKTPYDLKTISRQRTILREHDKHSNGWP